MALAIDIMHGCGPNNGMCHHLQPKNKDNTVLAVNIAEKDYIRCKVLTRQSTLVLKKNLCRMGGETFKRGRLVVLQQQLQLKTILYRC